MDTAALRILVTGGVIACFAMGAVTAFGATPPPCMSNLNCTPPAFCSRNINSLSPVPGFCLTTTASDAPIYAYSSPIAPTPAPHTSPMAWMRAILGIPTPLNIPAPLPRVSHDVAVGHTGCVAGTVIREDMIDGQRMCAISSSDCDLHWEACGARTVNPEFPCGRTTTPITCMMQIQCPDGSTVTGCGPEACPAAPIMNIGAVCDGYIPRSLKKKCAPGLECVMNYSVLEPYGTCQLPSRPDQCESYPLTDKAPMEIMRKERERCEAQGWHVVKSSTFPGSECSSCPSAPSPKDKCNNQCSANQTCAVIGQTNSWPANDLWGCKNKQSNLGVCARLPNGSLDCPEGLGPNDL